MFDRCINTCNILYSHNTNISRIAHTFHRSKFRCLRTEFKFHYIIYEWIVNNNQNRIEYHPPKTLYYCFQSNCPLGLVIYCQLAHPSNSICSECRNMNESCESSPKAIRCWSDTNGSSFILFGRQSRRSKGAYIYRHSEHEISQRFIVVALSSKRHLRQLTSVIWI